VSFYPREDCHLSITRRRTSGVEQPMCGQSEPLENLPKLIHKMDLRATCTRWATPAN